VAVCPEVEVGMGTPREPLQLVRHPGGSRMVTTRTGTDWTERMAAYAERRLDRLAGDRLRGFILKKDSPSCGTERVRLCDPGGVPSRDGRGLFAAALLERFPSLPVEDEGRLNDKPLRENFVARVYTYDRWRRLADSSPSAGKVVAFHSRHKLLILAHDPERYYRLGRLVAATGTLPRAELLERYEHELMASLRRPAPVGHHVNTLHHIMGFLKDVLSSDDKAAVLRVIEEYREGTVPLVAPLTLLGFHSRRADVAWIREQVYLDPYPRRLGLRSHV
jgi:uncharacterized protein YbgA (DUF1722 family)/uncharacterized protein YbbK (DUF523 family)